MRERERERQRERERERDIFVSVSTLCAAKALVFKKGEAFCSAPNLVEECTPSSKPSSSPRPNKIYQHMAVAQN